MPTDVKARRAGDDGYAIDRRGLVRSLGWLAIGLLPVVRDLRAAAVGDARAWEAFLAEANPVAGRLVADRSAAGQDRYLRTVAALTSRLVDVPMPERFNDSSQGIEPGSYRIGFNPGGETFRVLHWRLAPGGVCRPHAHTYGNVVSLCIEGAVRVRNYEVAGEPDYGSEASFPVRQTVDQWLTPGAVNLVSLARNYIHAFEAGPQGARGIDITTPLAPRPDYGTPYLDIAGDGPQGVGSVFDARWRFDD